MNLLSFPDQNFCINCGLLKDLIFIVKSEILCNTCKNDYDSSNNNSALKETLKLSEMVPSYCSRFVGASVPQEVILPHCGVFCILSKKNLKEILILRKITSNSCKNPNHIHATTALLIVMYSQRRESR